LFDFTQTTILSFNDAGQPKKALKFTKISIGIEAISALCDTVTGLVSASGALTLPRLGGKGDLHLV
jgi:hypothetical protein